ncbi:MAG TPA: phage holin family protein [Polyangia bacterium]|nr:phage holin family protein [Polyangia bacterium]
MASRQSESDEREGIVGLVRETIDGLRTLIADHIKLARVELETDLKSYAGGVAVLVVAGLILAIGYVFAWIAAAIALGRVWGTAMAFAVVAAFNLLVGFVAVMLATGRMKRTRLMHGSAIEARTSVTALTHPLTQGRAS